MESETLSDGDIVRAELDAAFAELPVDLYMVVELSLTKPTKVLQGNNLARIIESLLVEHDRRISNLRTKLQAATILQNVALHSPFYRRIIRAAVQRITTWFDTPIFIEPKYDPTPFEPEKDENLIREVLTLFSICWRSDPSVVGFLLKEQEYSVQSRKVTIIRHYAAKQFQAVIRGFVHRIRHRRMLEAEKEKQLNEIRQWSVLNIQKVARGFLARKSFVRSYRIRKMLSKEVLRVAEKYLQSGDLWGFLKEINDELSRANDELHENEQRESEWATQFIEKVIVTRQNQFDKAWDNFPKALANFNRKPVSVATLLDTYPSSSTSALAGSSSIHTGAGNALANKNKTTDQQRNTSLTLLPNTRNKTQFGQPGSYIIANSPDSRSQGHPHQLLLQKGASTAAGFGQHETGRALSPMADAGFLAIENGDISTENGLVPVMEDDTSQLSLEQSLESLGHGRTSPTPRAPFRSSLPYSASAHSLLSTQSGGLNKHVAEVGELRPAVSLREAGRLPLREYDQLESQQEQRLTVAPAAKERTVVVAEAAGRGRNRNSISSSGVSVSVSIAGNSIESPTAGFGGTAGYSLASAAGKSTVGASGFAGVTHEVHNIPGPMARKALRSTVDAEVKKELHRLISNDKRSRQLTQGIVEVYGPNSDPKKLFGSKSQSNATSRAAGIGGKSQKKLKPVVDMTQKFKKKRKRRNLDGTFVEPKGKIEASHSGSWVACHSLSMSSHDDDTVGGVSVDNDTLRSLASDGSGSIKHRSSSSSGQRRASGGTNSSTAFTNAHLQPGNSLLLDIPHGIEDSLERLLHAAALRCFVPDFFQGVPVSSYSNDQLDSGGEEGVKSGEDASTRGKMRKRGTFARSNVNANADYAYQMYLSMPMGLAKMKYELECKKFSQGPINRLRLKGLNFIQEVVPKSKMVMCLKNVDTPMVLINKVVELFVELKKMAAAPEGGTHIPAMQQYPYPEAGALTEEKLIQQQQQPQQKLQGEGKGSSNPADRIKVSSNSNSSSLDRGPRRSPQSASSAAARGGSPVSIMRGGDGTSSPNRNHTPQQQSVNFSPCTSRPGTGPGTGPGASYSDGLGVNGGVSGCAADGARRSDASVEYAAENKTTDDSGGDALLDESEFKRESAEAKKANREKAELPSKLLLSMVENEGAWCKMSSTVEDIFLHAAYLVVPHTRKVLFEDPNKPSKKKRYRDVSSKMGNIAFKEHTKDMLNLENEEDKREMVKERFRSALILCTPYCIHLKQRGVFTVSDLLKVRIREALPSIEQELETQLEALLTIVVGKAVNSKVLPTIRDHLSTAENMFMVPMIYDPKFQRSPFDPFGKPPRLVDSTFRIHPPSSKSSIASQAVGGRPSYSNQAMGISTTSPILAAAAAAVATTAEGVGGVADAEGFTAHGIAGVFDKEEDEDAEEEAGDDSEEDSYYKNPSRAGMNPVYGGDPGLTKGAIRKDLAQPISLWQQQRQHRGHAASGQSLHRRSSLDSTNNTVVSDTDISALTSDHQWTFQPAQSHHNFRGSTPPASAAPTVADGGGGGGDDRAGEMDNIARISMKSTAADRLRYTQAVENKTAAIGSGRGFAHTAPQLRTSVAHANNASGALSPDPPISSGKDRLPLSVPIHRGAAVADGPRQVHTPPRSPSRGAGTAAVAVAPTGGAIPADGSHRLLSGDDSVSVLEDGGGSVGQYTSVEVSNRYQSQHQPKHHERQRYNLTHSQSERKNRPSSVEKGKNIGKGQTDKGSGGKHNGNISQEKGFRQNNSFNTRSSADTQIFRNTYTCTHPHCGLVFSRAYTYKVHLKSHEVFSQYHAFKRRPQLGLDSDISQGNAAAEALYEQRTSLPPIVQAQLNAHKPDGGEYSY